MKNLTFLFVFLAVLACSKKTFSETHNSMNSLDWAGVYSGSVLVNEKATASTLVLNYDKSYTLFLENKRISGLFKWKSDGQTIVLGGAKPCYFFVGENYLKASDNKGLDLGRLDKNESITEKYWKLVSLNGKPAKRTEREAHLIFKANDRTLKGFTGCNHLNAKYTLDESALKVKIENDLTTLMACLEENNEAEFFKVLELVDNYSFSGETLKFYDEKGNLLAVFEVVYLR